MKFCIIIETKEIENAWNAFQFATTALKDGNVVKLFLMGEAVGWQYISRDQYDFAALLKTFVEMGGIISAEDISLRSREMSGTDICPSATMQDCNKLVEWSDRVITF